MQSLILGTVNVITACEEACVASLVYCSSISTVQGYFSCLGGTETELYDVSPLMFRDYGGTKKEAEQLVLKANGTSLSNGNFHIWINKLTWKSTKLIARFYEVWHVKSSPFVCIQLLDKHFSSLNLCLLFQLNSLTRKYHVMKCHRQYHYNHTG